MQVKLSKHSIKFLKNLTTAKFERQIAIKIKQLAIHGHLGDSKPLRGNLVPYYRTDVGEFRIIYKIENDDLLIDLIGKRNDGEVYKLMERVK